MDAHTKLAVKKFFDHNSIMEVDKVYENGESEVVTFTNYYEVIDEFDNAYDYQLFMPI